MNKMLIRYFSNLNFFLFAESKNVPQTLHLNKN